MNKRITLNDVALEAGVSKSTVSFVLNKNRPISEGVTRKVLETMARLNYTPKEAARMLSRRNSNTIGVLIITCNDPFGGVILEAVNREISARNYRMQLHIAGEGRENAIAAIKQLSANGSVDGIINMLSDLSLNETMRYSNGIPTITYLRPQITSPVYLDFIAAMHNAMDYLYSLGHRRIGFISGRDNEIDIGEEPRLTGFKQYLVRKNLEENLDLIEYGRGVMESGMQLAYKLYSKGATAIICVNDQTAAGVVAWAHENGIRVPDQLSVIGFDDSPISTYVYPPLTTMQIPAAELAAHTVEAIIENINGKRREQHVVMTPHLIVRKSTGKVPEKVYNSIRVD